jgi:hypothetical protein
MENKTFAKKIIILGVILFIGLFIILPNFNIALATETAAEPNITLQIPLLSITKVADIADYIKYIYKAATFIIIPIIIVVIIFAGIEWLSAAGRDIDGINKAKKRLQLGLIGLGIVLFSYILLSFVGITVLKLPGIEYIEPLDTPDLDVPPPPNYNFNTDFKAPTGAPGSLYCPKSGGQQAIPQIAASAKGKITYRLGGKAWKQTPPFGEKKSQYMKYNSYCPSGTLCVDCSGFTNYVYNCAGLKAPPAYTGNIFGCNCGSSEKINTFTDTSINGQPLVPGDMLGIPSGCGNIGIEMGHVVIYVGNSTLYDVHGGHEGRQPGNAVGTFTPTWFLTKDPNHAPAHYKCVKRYK